MKTEKSIKQKEINKMNKKVFEIMLKEADNFRSGDLWIIDFEGQKIYFDIKSKSRWWIEAYCLTDKTNYRISRKVCK